VHVLGNVECEKAKNALKTKIRPVCVLSEYDAWENGRVILTVSTLWVFCEGRKMLKESLHMICLHEL